jgi:glutamyl-tRNA reductase
VNGRAITLEELSGALEHADIVISCTASPVPVLGKGVVERALKNVGIAPFLWSTLPCPGISSRRWASSMTFYLYTVDDLHEAIESNVRQRQRSGSRSREADRANRYFVTSANPAS